ncbi:DUF1345 domain-containing protein [Microbacterium luticocti]|uniref:DUF1345 domain-containing protein n=1 Tax=Microbacterium luticocti TaxID=451764 RepID=UPI00040D1585|nr:DUF1345 domain-containing protein [Microbacterium luticocti]
MARARIRLPIAVRGAIAVVVGIVVGVVVTPVVGVAAGLLGGWTALALVAAVWSLAIVWPMDADQTRTHALREDPGRRASHIIAILGSVVSIGAVVAVLTETRQAHGVAAFVLAGIALVSVAASWLLIQTVYLLRLADAYYGEPVGGIVFNQDDDPTYTDFAYIAFGVGLTYQVADTNVTTNRIRRVIIAQSMLGYLFGAVILGTVINLLAGL